MEYESAETLSALEEEAWLNSKSKYFSVSIHHLMLKGRTTLSLMTSVGSLVFLLCPYKEQGEQLQNQAYLAFIDVIFCFFLIHQAREISSKGRGKL